MSFDQAVSRRSGRLAVGGLPARALAEKFGTPLYVYSADIIQARFKSLQEAFKGPQALFCYALKANSSKAVCGVLARAGAGADIVSGGELDRAVAAGFKPEKIVFSGVGKTSVEMDAALARGILAFHVESTEELKALSAVARRRRKRAPFSVRVNPDIKVDTHRHITTGTADNKFGVEPREAMAMYRFGARDPWLSPVGIQCHLGSQITEPGPYGKALDRLLSMIDALAEQGLTLSYADIGGGMGIPYASGRTLEPKSLAKLILPRLKARPKLRLLLEPGRWLVGPAGVLLTEVLYRKKTSRRRFVIVDAGMNDLLRPALYGAVHAVHHERVRRGRVESFDLVGPVCETADRFLEAARGVLPQRGELIAIDQAGAYGFSMSSNYNSRPRPAEVMVEKGRARLIRARESLKSLCSDER